MHVTATPFWFFHSAWINIFGKGHPTWRLPTPSVIGEKLLSETYDEVVLKTIETMKSVGCGRLNVDGAVGNRSKSKSDFIL